MHLRPRCCYSTAEAASSTPLALSIIKKKGRERHTQSRTDTRRKAHRYTMATKELGLPGWSTKIYCRSRSADPDGRQSEIITIESISRARLPLLFSALNSRVRAHTPFGRPSLSFFLCPTAESQLHIDQTFYVGSTRTDLSIPLQREREKKEEFTKGREKISKMSQESIQVIIIIQKKMESEKNGSDDRVSFLPISSENGMMELVAYRMNQKKINK